MNSIVQASCLRVASLRLCSSHSRPILHRRGMGFLKEIFFPSERQIRKEFMLNHLIRPGDARWELIYANTKPSQLSLESGIPDKLLDDPHLYCVVTMYNELIEKLNITPEKEVEFLDSYDISPGSQGLDSALELPIPHHTFAQLPVIKEPEEEAHEKAAH